MSHQKRKKSKIVLDADVIIHFEEGGCFSTLLDIFPEYEYIVLNVVYTELRKTTKRLIDNCNSLLKKLTIIDFAPTGDSRRDYAALRKTKGAGESASMIYCRDNRDILGSSNLSDIRDFCKTHGIPCLTTLDFLFYAFTKGRMTTQECNEFMEKVKLEGHNLPKHVTDIEQYKCTVEV